MKIVYTNAELHLGNGDAFRGTLAVEDGRVVAVYSGDIRAEDLDALRVDLCGATVLPGLVDVHTHGRAGYDFTTASLEAMQRMAQSYLDSGVTALMPTLASAPLKDLCDAADRIVAERETLSGARFLGVHLEGRYLNPNKRGAHAEELLAEPRAEELSQLLAHMPPPAHLTCAPECDRSDDHAFIRTARAHGVSVGIGHTEATYAEALMALDAGASSFTHLYNVMPPLHHRAGGTVAAALLSDAYAELICDGMHIAPEMVKLAYRLKGQNRLVLITDSMEATACPDGEYAIAGQKCIVKGGCAMTLDGHLAGSTLSLIDGLRNLMRFCDISLDEALPTVARNPTEMVGVSDRVGLLLPGRCADFLVFNRRFSADDIGIYPDAVYLGGRRVERGTVR